MVKVIVPMFVCFALVAFATAKHLSHEVSPQAVRNNVIVTHTQLRSLEVILGEIHHAIGTVLEHIAMYDQNRLVSNSTRLEQDDICRQINCNKENGKINTITINSGDSHRHIQTYCIGNGNGNINYVTVNNCCRH